MHDAGAVVGAGGYDEARLIYAAPAFAGGAVVDERRTVHIGLDLTMPAGSPIHAPFDGVVHGFEDAATRLDYGPVIVLRHDIPGEAPVTFYTLYGHLSRQSLEGLHAGKPVKAGERFATIGPPPENGDWWPHVHVQVITDMLDVPCNFNGVAPHSQRATWLSLCPDPNLMLGIPAGRFARHATTADLLERRRLRFGGNVRLSYAQQPVQIVRGWKQYLFDETGRTYIDGYNNVPHVGHAHPAVTRAVAAQLATLNTNTRYLHELVIQYAEALAATFPAPLEVCYFTASGSEANELALRLARAYTGARDLVVMDGAYHGHTTTLIDISPYKHAGPGGRGAPDWVHSSPIPDVYRGAHKADDPDAGAKYARDGRRSDRPDSRGRARPVRLHRGDVSQRGRADRDARRFSSGGLPPGAMRPAACASRTKCRRASVAWAATSGRSRPTASCRTSSCSASPSPTAIRWARSSPRAPSRTASTTGWSSSAPSAAAPPPAPLGWRRCGRPGRKACRPTR